MSKKKLKPYRVYITQYCEPIVVRAKDEDDARNRATEDHVWEVTDVDFRIEDDSEPTWEEQNGLS
jgi:hypothetical protein